MPSLTRPDQPTTEWTDIMIPTLAGGVNSAVPAHLLDDSESPDSRNLVYSENRAKVDTGYSPKGEFARANISATSTEGSVLLVFGKGVIDAFRVGGRIDVPLFVGGGSLVTTIVAIDTISLTLFDTIEIADPIPAGENTSGAIVTQSKDLWGIGQGSFDHQTVAGAVTPLLVTTKTCYRYIGLPTDEWQYVAGTVTTTLSANEAAQSDVMNVADTTGFAVGKRIGIFLDDGSQHQTTIASIAAGTPGTITIDDKLPGYTGTTASSGNGVLQAIELAGSADKQLVFVAVPWHEWSVFTNGVDVPMRYDGTTFEVIPNLPSAGNTICDTLGVFSEAYLILGAVTEGGTSRPYRLLWCAAGDATDWSSGSSGAKDLLDTRDSVVAMKVLGTNMIVYRTRTPVIMSFFGQPYATFRFAPLALGESLKAEGFGPVSANAVAGTSDQHIIMDRRGVFVYAGGTEIRDISEKVFGFVFGSDGLINRTTINRSFAHFIEGTSTLWLFYPDSASSYPNRAAVLDTKQSKWWHRKFNQELTFASASSGSTSTRIIDLVGSILDQRWKVGSGSAVLGAFSVALGVTGISAAMASVTDAMAQYDGITAQEFRQPISWSIDSSEHRGQRNFLLDHVRLQYKGPVAQLFILRDSKNPQLILTTVGSGVFEDIEAFPQTVQRRVTFRLIGASSGGEIGELSFKFRDASRWAH